MPDNIVWKYSRRVTIAIVSTTHHFMGTLFSATLMAPHDTIVHLLVYWRLLLFYYVVKILEIVKGIMGLWID